MNKIMKFKLPIDITDVACVTDCWIFNRLIIIKTSPYYNDWIASHYNLQSISTFNFQFGELDLTEPGYHDLILERKTGKFSNLNKENFIGYLCKHLLDGYYINILIKDDLCLDYFHEVTIYGFDNTKECFFAVGFENRTFRKHRISFFHMVDSLDDIKNHLKSNQIRSLELSMYYQSPITFFKVKNTYCTDNCVVEAYKKIKLELNGKKMPIEEITSIDNSESKGLNHTGLQCLWAAYDMLKNELAGQPFSYWFRGISSAIKKLLEHRRMLLHSMKYVYEHWKIAMKLDAYNYIEDYNKSCLIVERWLNLALHYEMTGNTKDIEIIFNEIPNVFENEKNILTGFLNDAIDWNIYYENFV